MTSYVVRGKPDGTRTPRVLWHCVDEETDPWVSFASIARPAGYDLHPIVPATNEHLAQMARPSVSGPGASASADVVNSEGAIVFDSPQHYTGWVKFSGVLMGYPLESVSDIEGTRRAACTSPED